MDDTHASYVELAYAEHERIERSLAIRFPGEDAEGHVAEAYARCCKAAVRDADHAVKWVARVAGHLAIDATRGHAVARRHAPDLPGPQTAESAEDWYLRQERSQRLTIALAALPPDERDVMLAVAEGLRAKDIATQLGRTVYAVKHVIARTRKQLQEQLRDAQLALVGFGTRLRRRSSRVPYGAGTSWVTLLLTWPAVAGALPVALGAVVSVVSGPATSEPGFATAASSNNADSVALSPSAVAVHRAGLAPPGGIRRNAGPHNKTHNGELHPTVKTSVSVILPKVVPGQIDNGKDNGDGKTGLDEPPWINDDDSCLLEGDVTCVANTVQECVHRGPVISPGRIGCPEDD